MGMLLYPGDFLGLGFDSLVLTFGLVFWAGLSLCTPLAEVDRRVN